MPTYIYKCQFCSEIDEEDYAIGAAPDTTICCNCGETARRYWAGESKVSTFHPTKDLYANSLKAKGAKTRSKTF
jgi:predicted nucleic acid-binding Zn ribbon protein